MDKYSCTIVDEDGFTVEEFQHIQTSLNNAKRFELMILEGVRARDNAKRFFYSDNQQLRVGKLYGSNSNRL